MSDQQCTTGLFRLAAATCTAGLSLLFSACHGDPKTLDDVQRLVDAGQYKVAKQEIQSMQEDSNGIQHEVAFEAERMRRIEMEFTLDEHGLADSIRRYIPDASDAEIAQWNADGLLEYKLINGEKRYFARAAYNLLHKSPEALARKGDYQLFTARAPLYQLHAHHHAVLESEQPLRNRFEITYRLSVDADAVPHGETVRAWIPFPKTVTGRQENITLIGSTPASHQLAPTDRPQRTIYLEQSAQAGKATEFSVTYAFDSLSQRFDIDPDIVTAIEDSATLTPFLSERAPHVVFTRELRALSERIVGDETNPYRIAQKLFSHVDAIPWASAREYSTIRNISAYAAGAGHADCGQQTLLLITLLRMNGIPARWQSGWEFSPSEFDTMHDWGEIYLAPYGWMPMDVTHGRLGGEEATDWFYLGGIDAYRLIFNSDYGRPFFPAKQHFRSETVDSQRGEVEWRGGNLYFDQWDYSMDWKPVELAQNGGTAGE